MACKQAIDGPSWTINELTWYMSQILLAGSLEFFGTDDKQSLSKSRSGVSARMGLMKKRIMLS